MPNTKIRVDYGKAIHGEEEIRAVVHVLRSSTQMGRHVRKFEAEVAARFGQQFGVMVNSGSSALLLAVQTSKLDPGSEVITPVLTFATTVASILKNGLVPAFVDVDRGTYNVDISRIEQLITKRTTAMLVPNLLGNLPDWDQLASIARKYELTLIEDSADTLGAQLRGHPTGERAETSITSFYGSHVINCAGNGGMLCTDDEKVAEHAKLLRSWGRSSSLFEDSEKTDLRFDVEIDGIPYDKKFVFQEIGYNFEPSEIGAAYGLVQLNRLDENIDIRINNFNSHFDFFSQFEEFFVLPSQLENSRTGWLAFPLTIRDSAPFTRREFQIELEKANIQTRTVFTGNILRQPGFKSIECRTAPKGYEVADEVMRGGVLIGCHHGLAKRELDYVHDVVSEFIRSAKSYSQ